MDAIPQRSFYCKNTLDVARGLLGCFVVRKVGRKIIRARIVETEAYAGEDDLASHASRGRTPRTEIMYGEPGRAYVYMIYGMYHCLNIVTEEKDYPAAVLVRALSNPHEYMPNIHEWREIVDVKLDGPGKLCQFLQIDRSLNDWDVTKGERLWIEFGDKVPARRIVADKRVGIDYALHCKEYLWRFTLKTEK